MRSGFAKPQAVARGVLDGHVGVPAAVIWMTVRLVSLRARLAGAGRGTDFTALAGEAVAVAQAVDAVPVEVWDVAAICDLAGAAALVLEDIHDAAIAEAVDRCTIH